MSMDDLKKKEEGQKDDSQQEFYAGGNDNRSGGGSGLATLGPPSNSNDPFDRIMNKAMNESGQGEASSNGSAGAGNDELKLTLYRNGFTVDEGPLRELDNPDNMKFVDDLMRGYIPTEIVKSRHEKGLNPQLNVNISDKRGEDYRAPTPPAYVAYSGEGSSLGKVASGGALIDPSTADMQASPPSVDASQPTTLLQVKLADGSKIKVKLNKHHTVRDLVAMIVHRPGGAGGSDAPYYLCAGFPPKDVTDDTLALSLQDAGLVGAAIVQKIA